MPLVEREGVVELSVAEEVEERLEAAMGILNVASAQVVSVVAEALERGAWQGIGIRSPEHWLTWRAGISAGRARRLVAMARALADLPAASAALTEGALSEDQAHVVCRHVDPHHDEEATTLARGATVAQLARALPGINPRPPEEDDDGANEGPDPGPGDTPRRREVGFGYGDDGKWWLRASLHPEEGALVQKALEAARDALFGGRGQNEGPEAAVSLVGCSDALLKVAEAALANIEGSGRAPAGRYQVILHANLGPGGLDEGARTHLGPALPSWLRRYLGCDATSGP